MITFEISTHILPLQVVGVVVHYQNKILLLKRQEGKRHAGYWGLPAGKIDQGESAEGAMVRELFEETGIVCEEKDLKLDYTFNVDQGDQQFTYYYFKLILEAEPKVLLQPKEHCEYAFVPVHEAVTMQLVPGELECLNYVYKR